MGKHLAKLSHIIPNYPLLEKYQQPAYLSAFPRIFALFHISALYSRGEYYLVAKLLVFSVGSFGVGKRLVNLSLFIRCFIRLVDGIFFGGGVVFWLCGDVGAVDEFSEFFAFAA